MDKQKKQMLDKLIYEFVEEMYQAEKLTVMFNQGLKDSDIDTHLSSLVKSEAELLHFHIGSNPGGLFHCRSVLNTYKHY